ncbi:MAG: InlB B-repeat-containing protein [Verrucomicrobiota bacterium]
MLTNSGGLTKSGYVFSGWNTLATGLGTDRAISSSFTMGTANVTLYAKWVSAATYTVTYDGNGSDGGSVPLDSGAYLNGATVTVLANSGGLTRTGYVFSGWNTLASGLGSSYAASGSATFTIGTANVTLYARWISAATYSVTYNGNGSDGGSVPTDSNNYLNGATVSVLANTGTLTRTNSVFVGWNTATNGSGTSYAATGSATFSIGSANVTLYAQWTVTATWANTGATNGNWNTADNWVSGIVPGSSAPITGSNADAGAAIFNTTLGSYASAANPLVIDSTSENIKNITFDTAAGNFVIGSTGLNPLFLTSGGSIQIPNTLTATNALETINAPLVIEGAGGNYAITNNSAVGTGANAGTLQIGGGITGGAAGSTVLTLNGSNTNANTISGIIAQGSATSLAITKADIGTWILSNDNRYIGATNITGGTLKLGATGGTTNTPLGTTAAGTTVSSGAALDLNGFTLGTAEALSITGAGVSSTGALTNSGAPATYSGVVTLAAASSIGGSGDISLASGLVGNVILTKVGANALTLSSASSRSGETKLSAGTLILNNDTALGSGQLTITAAGTTLDNTSGAPRTLNNVLATSSTFDFSVFNSNSTATSNLSFTGTTALAIPSAGSPAPPRTITLNGTGTTLTLGAVTAQANAAGGKLQIDGPGNTLVMGSLITNSNTASVHNFVLQGSANVTINGTVSNPSGAGTFTMSSTGTVTFKGANSYTGATTVTAGTLALVGGSQASAITVNSGASLGFILGSATSSSSSLNFLAGSKVKIITGSPTQPSYTLMTASAFPGVLPTLDPAIPGYSLVVDGSALKLSLTGGTSAFNTWAISPPNNLVGTDAAFDFDYDKDGIANGLEWILGGNPKLNDSATILPTSTGNAGTGLTLVFSRNPDSIATSTLVVEWNTDLAAFANTITIGASNVNVPPADNSPSVYIDTPTTGKVTVIIPAANAPTGKIFARLKATLP